MAHDPQAGRQAGKGRTSPHLVLGRRLPVAESHSTKELIITPRNIDTIIKELKDQQSLVEKLIIKDFSREDLRGAFVKQGESLQRCKLLGQLLAGCPNIKRLRIQDNVSLAVVSAEYPEVLKKIEELDLSNCRNLTDENIRVLENCTELKALDLSGCEGVGSIRRALRQCTKLQILNLSKCRQLSIDVLANCPELRILNLSHCELLGSIRALAQCRQLQTLDLSFCRRLRDIDALAQCTQLKTLNLFFCSELQNVDALAACQELRTLNLSSCNKVLNIDALGRCPELQTLYLGGGRQSLDISALAQCKLLQTLSMWMCSVSNISALALCKELEVLHLCENYVLEDISALASCPELKELDLRGCNKVSRESVIKLMKSNPGLKDVTFLEGEKMSSESFAHRVGKASSSCQHTI